MKKESYIIYKGFIRLEELPNLEQVGRLLGTKKQNINKGKKADGFYKWKDYYVIRKDSPLAVGYYYYLRLGWMLNNPALTYPTAKVIKKAVEEIEAKFLEDD